MRLKKYSKYCLAIGYLIGSPVIAMNQLAMPSSSAPSQEQENIVTIQLINEAENGKNEIETRKLTMDQIRMLQEISPVINDLLVTFGQKINVIPFYSLSAASFDQFFPFLKETYKLKMATRESQEKRIEKDIDAEIDKLSLSEKLNVFKVADYLLVQFFKDILINNIARNAQTEEQLKIFKKNPQVWQKQNEYIMNHPYLRKDIAHAILQPCYFELLKVLTIPPMVIQTSGGLLSLAWSPDGTKLASGASDNVIQIWDSITGKLLNTLRGHTNIVHSVAWSPDGNKIASGSVDQTIRIWDSSSGNEIKILATDSMPIESVIWSPDGSKLASGSGKIHIWDSNNWNLLNTFDSQVGRIYSLAWSPDNNKIASGSASVIQIWDSNTGKILHAVKGHKAWVDSVAWSSDGIKLASGSWDKTIRIWNGSTGKRLNTFLGHTEEVSSVQWNPRNSMLASGSWDMTVRIWDSIHGQPLKILKEKALVNSIVWSPDGSKIASGLSDKIIRIRDISSLLDTINILKNIDLQQALFIVYALSGKKWDDSKDMKAIFKTLPESIKNLIKLSITKNYFKKRFSSSGKIS